MNPAELTRLISMAVPRYTSYPTTPHFHSGVDEASYAGWLEALGEGKTLSLYAHIPYCDSLCWFCGCHTRITRRYEPVGFYVGGLSREIALIAERLPGRNSVTHLHWGGGSPTMLAADDIKRLAAGFRERFSFAADAEFAVEVDPRGLDQPRIDALADAGLTRVSIGVQDFDPEVQWAINREQSFEETRRAVDAFRAKGVRSLNIDVLYGLPYQTETRVISTLEQVLALSPDRIALFGYAHVPWMKKHQEMIAPESLPGTLERFRQAESAARLLSEAGYQRVGIDHFAKADDALAKAQQHASLRRNFQGYTVDPADALIGFGASAIGGLPQGYVQSEPTTGRYLAMLSQGRLPVARGLALSDHDRLHRAVIESIMCMRDIRMNWLQELPGTEADKLAVRNLIAGLRDERQRGWVTTSRHGLSLHEEARPFLRLIAAQFDAYLTRSAGRHSAAV
jgi:oxygen-independent coproporphyrinogen-3 oxidase